MKPSFIVSAASFYFWTSPYHLPDYVSIVRELSLPVAGIDLYFDADPSSQYPRFEEASLEYLAGLDLRVLHTDFTSLDWRVKLEEHDVSEVFDRAGRLAEDVLATHLVVHGEFLVRDAAERCAWLRSRLPPGVELALELVEGGRYFATQPSELEAALAVDERLKLVPDTAHMQDFDYPWEAIFLNETLRSRICMVHVSNHSRHLAESLYGDTMEGREAVHSMCIARVANFPPAYLHELRRYPLVLEGIVPRGEEGLRLLRHEMAFLAGSGA